jgi:hypothetical protein
VDGRVEPGHDDGSYIPLKPLSTASVCAVTYTLSSDRKNSTA